MTFCCVQFPEYQHIKGCCWQKVISHLLFSHKLVAKTYFSSFGFSKCALKGQQRLAQGKRSDTLGYELP